jgi:predicted dehydrogenase
MDVTRRSFVQGSVAGMLASTAPAAPQTPVTVGVVGAGIRGIWLIGTARDAGAKIAMVADLYDGHLRRAQEVEPGVAVTRDYKEVIQRSDIQAVIVATADHWHSQIAIEAMRAGKDVYVEKPMTHTIPQALEMVKVSKETGRLVQVGSQAVSMQTTNKAKEWIEAGRIGNIFMVQCTIYRPNAVGAWRYPVPYDASPKTIDWDRFLGNAPKRPFDAERFFHFRNFWDYGTGIAGDEYVHLLTRVHHCLKVRFPLSAYAQGGIYKWKGDRDVPDIHNTLYDYGKFQVQVNANLASNWDGGEYVRFMGDLGTIELQKPVVKLFPYQPRESYSYPTDSWPKDQRDRFAKEHPPERGRQERSAPEQFEQTREGTEDHFRNLFQCMQTREQPSENVEFGLGTSVACHMANLSYREKKRYFWDGDRLQLRT